MEDVRPVSPNGAKTQRENQSKVPEMNTVSQKFICISQLANIQMNYLKKPQNFKSAKNVIDLYPRVLIARVDALLLSVSYQPMA